MTRNKEVPQVMRGVYTVPECSVHEIQAEGPLCTSLEGLGNKFNYIWGEEAE